MVPDSVVLRYLPDELLLIILEYATHSPVRDIDLLCDLSPFESIYENQTRRACDEALRTKLTLVTTCRLFGKICRGYLYEDVRIRHGSSFLADTMERDTEMGKRVKRVVLSPEESEDFSIYEDIRRIFRHCPNIRMLYRPKGESLGNSRINTAQNNSNGYPHYLDVNLPSLQRIDWHHRPTDAVSVVSQLPPSFLTLPFLKTLSVGSGEWHLWNEALETEEDILTLQINVQSLRVCSLDAFGPGLRIIDLPHVERLVVERPESMYALYGLPQFGEQIKSLELGLHPDFARQDHLALFLMYCENVKDLYYPVSTTKPAHGSDFQLNDFGYGVKHVGLNAARPLEWFANSEIALAEGEENIWETIGAHFDSLCGERSRFRSLEKVTLFGPEWDEYLEDERFFPYIELLASRNVALVRDDGSVISSSLQR